MTKLKFLILSIILLASCSTKQRVYQAGPRGGCFFITDSGEKQYVDSSNCRNQAIVESAMTDLQRKELQIFREMFVKEFNGVAGCRLLTLDSAFRDGNYIYTGNAICDAKQQYVSVNIYNATLPSGKPIKVMDSYYPESRIFIDAENYTVIERVPAR